MQSPNTVKVACIQCSCNMGTIKENISKLTSLIREAAKNGAKLIVTPEACVTGYISQDMKTNWRVKGRPIEKQFIHEMDISQYAETVPGSSTDYFAKLAKELGVYITVALIEKETVEETKNRLSKQQPSASFFPSSEGPRFFNTLCLVSPKGNLVAKYRKIFPWWYPEKSYITAGTDVVTYDTEYGRVGLAICFDIHNILPLYKTKSLWALCYSINWVDVDPQHWFNSGLPEHLKKNGVDYYVLGANWSVDDEKKDFKGFGYSTIYGRNGEVISQAKSVTGSEIVYGNIQTNT